MQPQSGGRPNNNSKTSAHPQLSQRLESSYSSEKPLKGTGEQERSGFVSKQSMNPEAWRQRPNVHGSNGSTTALDSRAGHNNSGRGQGQSYKSGNDNGRGAEDGMRGGDDFGVGSGRNGGGGVGRGGSRGKLSFEQMKEIIEQERLQLQSSQNKGAFPLKNEDGKDIRFGGFHDESDQLMREFLEESNQQKIKPAVESKLENRPRPATSFSLPNVSSASPNDVTAEIAQGPKVDNWLLDILEKPLSDPAIFSNSLEGTGGTGGTGGRVEGSDGEGGGGSSRLSLLLGLGPLNSPPKKKDVAAREAFSNANGTSTTKVSRFSDIMSLGGDDDDNPLKIVDNLSFSLSDELSNETGRDNNQSILGTSMGGLGGGGGTGRRFGDRSGGWLDNLGSSLLMGSGDRSGDQSTSSSASPPSPSSKRVDLQSMFMAAQSGGNQQILSQGDGTEKVERAADVLSRLGISKPQPLESGDGKKPQQGVGMQSPVPGPDYLPSPVMSPGEAIVSTKATSTSSPFSFQEAHSSATKKKPKTPVMSAASKMAIAKMQVKQDSATVKAAVLSQANTTGERTKDSPPTLTVPSAPAVAAAPFTPPIISPTPGMRQVNVNALFGNAQKK